MNDEIKEILDELKEYASGGMSGLYPAEHQVKQLLDYITNLQQEKEDYKSRCEKAIEYNNQIIKDTKDFYRPTTDIIYSGDSLIEIATNNINILQNGSDDNEYR